MSGGFNGIEAARSRDGGALGGCYRDDVEAARIHDELNGRRWTQQRAPPATLWRPYDHARRVSRVRVLDECCGWGGPIQCHGLCTEGVGKPEHVDPTVSIGFRQPHQPRRLDIHNRPLGIERVSHSLAHAHQLFRLRVGAYGDEYPITGQACACLVIGKGAGRRLHPVRHAP